MHVLLFVSHGLQLVERLHTGPPNPETHEHENVESESEFVHVPWFKHGEEEQACASQVSPV